MLVYANEFYLQPSEDLLPKVKQGIKHWLDIKLGPSFRYTKIIPFSEPLLIRHPVTGQNEVSIIGTPDHVSDYCLSINFRHNDSSVNGRAWHTRIGIERVSLDAPMRVTVLVETSEVSPQVALHPVNSSKPGVVAKILNNCQIDPRTPGNAIKELNIENLESFKAEIADQSRRHPILVISPDDFSEKPLVDVNELRKQLVGLTQSYLIPDKRAAWRLKTVLPPYHTAWDGSITIISPVRDGRALGRIYKNDEIEAICHDTNKPFEQYLFQEITHRSNLPMSRRHISHDVVGRRLIAFRIAALRKQVTSMDGLEEVVQSYEEDRDKARKYAEDLEQRLILADETSESYREQIEELEKKIRTQQFLISQARKSVANVEVVQLETIPSTLAELIQMVHDLFSDQLILTNHAERTLRKSPYEDCARAWASFKVLANQFHAVFTKQLRMQDAIEALRLIPGQYAGNNSVSTAGRCAGYERVYNAKTYMLSKHIQLGNARDPRHCFRLYFEWEPAESKIVVLHAGEHLDTLST